MNANISGSGENVTVGFLESRNTAVIDWRGQDWPHKAKLARLLGIPHQSIISTFRPICHNCFNSLRLVIGLRGGVASHSLRLRTGFLAALLLKIVGEEISRDE